MTTDQWGKEEPAPVPTKLTSPWPEGRRGGGGATCPPRRCGRSSGGAAAWSPASLDAALTHRRRQRQVQHRRMPSPVGSIHPPAQIGASPLAPSLRHATAKISKATRQGGDEQDFDEPSF